MSASICRKMSNSARAIVVGHGTFPEGMIGAVELITGRGDMFIAVSNYGLSGDDIEARVRGAAAESGAKVFFSDLPAGSAAMAVRRFLRDNAECVLVTGANLAALLEFAFQQDMAPLEAARQAALKGRLALVVNGDA